MPFDRILQTLRLRHHITIVLPFLLADEGLTAEEIEFAIEKFTGYPVRLDRLKLLFESDRKRRKWKIDRISSEILKEIKRMREENGFGYIKISKMIYRKFDFHLSPMKVRELVLNGIDQIIEEKEREERRITEIERAVEEGRVRKLSLKELVWFSMRKNNGKVNAEIKRRLNELIERAEGLSVLDVL